MKVLLIFPPQNLDQRYSRDFGNVGGFLPPLGLCYMAAVLEKAGHEVRIMDCPVNNFGAEDIMKEVTNFNPEFVGIAAITTPFPGTQLWDNYEKYGTLDKNFSEYHGWSPVFVPFGYKNREELMAMNKEAFRRFYFRPQYVLNRITKIKSFSELKRNLAGIKVVTGMVNG